jgi:hypothetical protein
MECFSCGKQKNQVHPKKSDIIKGVTVLMCQSCIDAGYEPRWIIILGGRQNGPVSVKEYVHKRKYLGSEIMAHELIS